MARKTIKPTIVFADLHAVDLAVNEVKQLEVTIRTETATVDAQIARLTEDLIQKLEPSRKRLAELQIALERWALENKAQFETVRSKKFGSGIIGYRKGQPHIEVQGKTKIDAIVAAIKRLFKDRFESVITMKPSLNKEALLKWSEEDLHQVGLKKVQDDVFYIDTNEVVVREDA